MAEPAVDLYLPPSPTRRTPRGLTATAVAVVGVLLAGVVSLASMATASGSSTPQDALTTLLNDAAAGNVNAVIGDVDPVESAAMGPSVSAVVDRLKQLGVLDPGADLNRVSGVSASFTGVQTSAEDLSSIHSGLTALTFTAGSATVRIDPAQLPLGTLVKGFLGASTPAISKSFPLGGAEASKTPLVMIQRGDRWYLSIGYTIAEIVRRHAGVALPAAGAARPAAVGATTPEGVVRDLLAAAQKQDVGGVIGQLDPQEAAPLYDYSSLFSAHVHIPAFSVTGLTTSASDVTGGKLVTVGSFTVTAGAMTASWANGCLTVGTAAPMCPEAKTGIDPSKIGLVMVQDTASDGSTRWFLSPYRTIFDDLASAVATVNISDLSGLLGSSGLAPSGIGHSGALHVCGLANSCPSKG